ncbi:MAG: methyltransferase domain-containing protein [Crenarchaeota archaeon]|nr:methyltransferase domain-containing protein [Thermoproteota archaeon]
MERNSQRRIIRKIDLERFLSKINPHPSPSAKLEQYTTPESVAATILHLATYTYDDVQNKKIVDLGCGTGRLSLAAAFLGATSVVGIDIDKLAIENAIKNSQSTNLTGFVDWIIGDIEAISGTFDTVIQNPPFGVQKHAADRRFLKKALQVANTVYSIHNHPLDDKQLAKKISSSNGQLLQVLPSFFLKRLIEENGGYIEAVYALPFSIPHMFEFHTKAKHEVIIDLYVIKKKM